MDRVAGNRRASETRVLYVRVYGKKGPAERSHDHIVLWHDNLAAKGFFKRPSYS